MFDLTILAAVANNAADAVNTVATVAANGVADAANTAAATAAASDAANAQGELVAKEFGIGRMINEGGWVTLSIFAVLVIMSAGSWYITLTKLFEQNKVLKQSLDGVSKFWAAGTPRDGAAKFEKNSAYRQLLDDTMRAEDEHGKMKDPVDQHEWVMGSMHRSQNMINSKLGNGLSFLATVGSTSPFVGLLGTVIGIYTALITIGQSGDASIDKVAGPVGEALIMTAIGLIVAVPAVIGYNWLQRRNKVIAERMSKFCDDLHAHSASGGAVRPSVRAAAPAGKPAVAPAKA
jgi:biopolymer transport protein ExbB